MKINSIHYLRAVAILLIIAGHSYGPWKIDTISERTLANLITGSSALFVFISGFLFHHVHHNQFSYAHFMAAKVKYVLLPYVVLSLIGIVWFIFYNHPNNLLLIPGNTGVANRWELIGISAWYLWTGAILLAYWYIPFVMIIFLLSPVFLAQMNISIRSQLTLFFLLLCLSAVVQRPAPSLSAWNPIHSIIYYIPVYMFGTICSAKRAELFRLIKNRTFLLGVITLLFAIAQAVVYDSFGNFRKEAIFSFEEVDIMIFQKLFLCLFFLSLLDRLEHTNIPILNYTASISFALFFLHPWVLYFIRREGFVAIIKPLPGFVVFLLTTTAVIALSALLAFVIKLIMGKSSYILIGR